MTRIERLMQRFTVGEKPEGFPQSRVNTAGKQRLDEQAPLEGVKLVKGCGVSDPTTGKDNGFAEHTEEYVRFAMFGQEGIPMVVTMPKIEIHDAIAWVQQMRRAGSNVRVLHLAQVLDQALTGHTEPGSR